MWDQHDDWRTERVIDAFDELEKRESTKNLPDRRIGNVDLAPPSLNDLFPSLEGLSWWERWNYPRIVRERMVKEKMEAHFARLRLHVSLELSREARELYKQAGEEIAIEIACTDNPLVRVALEQAVHRLAQADEGHPERRDEDHLVKLFLWILGFATVWWIAVNRWYATGPQRRAWLADRREFGRRRDLAKLRYLEAQRLLRASYQDLRARINRIKNQ